VRSHDWAALARLDCTAHGARREDVFMALKRCATGTVCERSGALVGFALCRSFGRGYLVGPIVAESSEMAIALAAPHVRALEGTFLRVDVLIEADQLRRFLEEIGLTAVGRVTAMETKPSDRRMGSARIFALITQTLG
jgi:hypothetical protein